jgi:hypothetical protein
MLALSGEMLGKSGWMLNSVGLDAPPPQLWTSYRSGEMLDLIGSRGIDDVASIRASARNRLLQALPNRCTGSGIALRRFDRAHSTSLLSASRAHMEPIGRPEGFPIGASKRITFAD